MLRDIKQKSSSLPAMIVMGLLIIAFVFWGVSGSLMTASNDSAATVNGDKITINQFNQAFQSRKSTMTKQFGDNIGTEYFESENFKRGILDQLISSELLKQEAQKFDFDVSQNKIENYIKSSPGLQTDGKFSPEKYAIFLSQVKKSAKLLERDIIEDLKSSALPNMLSSSAFVIKSEIDLQYKLSKQIRTFNYVEITSKDFLDKVEVTDEEVGSHYKEFGSDYMTQEMVSVDYIELSTNDLLQNIEISDEDLLKYYADKKESLLTSETRKTSHILLPVEGNDEEVKNEIIKLAQRVAKGGSFAEIAKETSKDPGSAPNGGDLGWVSKGDMVKEFEEKLFSMKVGEVSEPVKTNFGYHLIQLLEVKSPEIPQLEDVKGELTIELKKQKAEEEFLTVANDLETTIIDSDNVIELAAETSGIELKTTELFARNRGVGIAANKEFSNTAFLDSIKVDNEISSMIDLGENHIAYVRIKEHKVPTQKSLDEVKEVITNKLKNDKALDLAKTNVEDYVVKLNAKELKLVDIAENLKKEVVEAKEVQRTGSKQPFNLVKNVFSLKFNIENKEATFVESSNNAFAIIDLIDVVDADASQITEEEKSNLTSQLERSSSNAAINKITEELRKKASITINEKIFEPVQ